MAWNKPSLSVRSFPWKVNQLQYLPSRSSYKTYVNQHSAGIGWALKDSSNKTLLQGSASIDATDTVLEAETLALKEAILQLIPPKV